MSLACDPNHLAALKFYQAAHFHVGNSEYADEVAQHNSLEAGDYSEQDFLRETAWVILCSGFRESSVRRLFDFISLCYCDWSSAREIVEKKELCIEAARAVFAYDRKLQAIANVASRISELGFERLRAEIQIDPITSLQRFSYIGPITSFHLAKNLGFDLAKPDRHLVRTAARFGFKDTFELCEWLANSSGDKVKVVDLVLWRYIATLQ